MSSYYTEEEIQALKAQVERREAGAQTPKDLGSTLGSNVKLQITRRMSPEERDRRMGYVNQAAKGLQFASAFTPLFGPGSQTAQTIGVASNLLGEHFFPSETLEEQGAVTAGQFADPMIERAVPGGSYLRRGLRAGLGALSETVGRAFGGGEDLGTTTAVSGGLRALPEFLQGRAGRQVAKKTRTGRLFDELTPEASDLPGRRQPALGDRITEGPARQAARFFRDLTKGGKFNPKTYLAASDTVLDVAHKQGWLGEVPTSANNFAGVRIIPTNEKSLEELGQEARDYLHLVVERGTETKNVQDVSSPFEEYFQKAFGSPAVPSMKEVDKLSSTLRQKTWNKKKILDELANNPAAWQMIAGSQNDAANFWRQNLEGLRLIMKDATPEQARRMRKTFAAQAFVTPALESVDEEIGRTFGKEIQATAQDALIVNPKKWSAAVNNIDDQLKETIFGERGARILNKTADLLEDLRVNRGIPKDAEKLSPFLEYVGDRILIKTIVDPTVKGDIAKEGAHALLGVTMVIKVGDFVGAILDDTSEEAYKALENAMKGNASEKKYAGNALIRALTKDGEWAANVEMDENDQISQVTLSPRRQQQQFETPTVGFRQMFGR